MRVMIRVNLFRLRSGCCNMISISQKRLITDSKAFSVQDSLQRFNELPFIDSRILQRSERSQISKVLRNIRCSKNLEELIGGLKYSIVGFSNEIRKNNGLLYVPENKELHLKGEIPKLTSVAFCVLYTIMYALRVNNDKSIKKEQLERLRSFRLLVNYKGQRVNITDLKKDVSVKYNTEEYDQFILNLINYYLYGLSQKRQQFNDGFEFYFDGKTITIEPEFIEILRDLLRTFERFSSYYGENKYVLQDLRAWIKSISSNDIVEACNALENRNLPPRPFLKDLLHRNVTSKYDLKLLVRIYLNGRDLFNQKEKRDALIYLLEKSQQYSFKDCIPILRAYLQSLRYFIRDENDAEKNLNVIANFKSVSNDYENESICAFTFNKLLWNLSIAYSKKNIIYSREMVKAQNYLLSHVSRLVNINPKNNNKLDNIPIKENLNILGKLGILNSQIAIDPTMISQIFEKFEIEALAPFIYKILNNKNNINSILTLNQINSNDIKFLLAKAYMIKLKLCRSKEELVAEFNRILRFPQDDNDSLAKSKETLIKDGFLCKSSLVWSEFILKLNHFKLLDSNRAVSVIKKILNGDIELELSSTQMVNLLITKCNDFQIIISLLKYLRQKKQLNSLIFQRILTKLYSAIIKSNNNYENGNKTEYRLNNMKVETHKDFLSYIRSLFNSFEYPNISIIGILLYYESFIQPDKIFELYKVLLNDRLPDNNCLKALLNASLINGRNLIWGEYYAVQIALNEFNEKTYKDPLDIKHIQPNESLWNIYMKALYVHNYYEDLSLLMARWDNLRYIPSKRLLCNLVSVLPEQEGNRLIKFGCSIVKDNVLVESSEEQGRESLDVDIGFEDMDYESSAGEFSNNGKYNVDLLKENYYVPIDEEYSVNLWPWPTQTDVDFTRMKIKSQKSFKN